MDLKFRDALEMENAAKSGEFPIVPASQFGIYRDFGKRVLDLAIVLATAIITLPVIMVLAFLVSLDGGSPFFRQRRVGRDNTVFHMWKLRSMVPDAEARLAAHLAHDPDAKREWDASQKLKRDPRITRIGRFIRKTSMDELPQLLNVLRGEMSLVGPRPMMCDQRVLYPGTAYYRLRPGISGFWQISDRNEAEFKSRAIYDLKYEQAVSLKTDLSVIARTFAVVMRCTGY